MPTKITEVRPPSCRKPPWQLRVAPGYLALAQRRFDGDVTNPSPAERKTTAHASAAFRHRTRTRVVTVKALPAPLRVCSSPCPGGRDGGRVAVAKWLWSPPPAAPGEQGLTRCPPFGATAAGAPLLVGRRQAGLRVDHADAVPAQLLRRRAYRPGGGLSAIGRHRALLPHQRATTQSAAAAALPQAGQAVQAWACWPTAVASSGALGDGDSGGVVPPPALWSDVAAEDPKSAKLDTKGESWPLGHAAGSSGGDATDPRRSVCSLSGRALTPFRVSAIGAASSGQPTPAPMASWSGAVARVGRPPRRRRRRRSAVAAVAAPRRSGPARLLRKRPHQAGASPGVVPAQQPLLGSRTGTRPASGRRCRWYLDR